MFRKLYYWNTAVNDSMHGGFQLRYFPSCLGWFGQVELSSTAWRHRNWLEEPAQPPVTQLRLSLLPFLWERVWIQNETWPSWDFQKSDSIQKSATGWKWKASQPASQKSHNCESYFIPGLIFSARLSRLSRAVILWEIIEPGKKWFWNSLESWLWNLWKRILI